MVFIFTNSNKRSTNVVKFDNSRGLALLLALAIAHLQPVGDGC